MGTAVLERDDGKVAGIGFIFDDEHTDARQGRRSVLRDRVEIERRRPAFRCADAGQIDGEGRAHAHPFAGRGHRTSKQLHELSDQRQSEVARDRVRDIQAQLNQVWRLNSMGQMAATLAHELNQPLTAATVYLHAGQADLARSGPLGDSAGRSLELAKAQLLRAGHIIRRMRDLISSGSRAFAEERVASMIDDLAPVFSLISRDTDVPIRIDIHDQDDAVLADRIQVQQAVTNLVRNGVDAVSDRRDGIISLVGRSLGPEGYEIIVEDNGPGIAETDLDRIFQPLTTTKAGGMGLGLSVTRSIVESHGSQLVVGRSPLGGAAFSFRLSRFTEAEAA